MKPFIVVPDGMDKHIFKQLCEMNDLEVYPKLKMDQDELKTLLPKVNGLIIRSATTVKKELLDQAPNLQYVIRAGAGTDNINKPLCNAMGIKVSNTPGANSNSAAEHAIALMMTVLRKTAWAHKSMSEGKWDKAIYSGNELSNKKIGIIGFGQIGQLVAKRLSGFEPEIKYRNLTNRDFGIPYANIVAGLEEIFSDCDIISLHIPKTADNENLVNYDLMSKMKPGAILINTARGGIVNEDDLIKILKEKRIRGAGFDVYATEPLPSNSPLRELDNIVLTPHLGASTAEAQTRVGEMSVYQTREFFFNNNLLNEVN